MRRIIVLMIFGMLLMNGCASDQEQIIGVILPVTKEHYTPYPSEKVTGTRTPTKVQIRKAQPSIVNYIKLSDKSIFQNLDKYRCQYFGFTVNGRKRIHCNFFWLTKDVKDWRISPVFILDGGDRYFQLEYDVETGRCLNFLVNGQA